jgi:prepilin-type N-terminal cleavage/methylation domain-containing protein
VPRPGKDRFAGQQQLLYPKAFTTIELLVAMAIIAILASLLFLGGQKLMGSSKAHSTRVSLAMLQSMLGELDAKTRLSKAPPAWRWMPANSNSSATVLSNSDMVDFWRIPYRTGTSDNPGPLEAMASLGNVTSDASPAVRNGAWQILNTQLVMNMLLGMNRTALQKVQPDRYMIPTWQWGPLPVPGVDGVFGTSDDSTSLTESVYYLRGMKVEYTDTSKQLKRYRCKLDHLASNAFASGNWVVDTSSPTPILLDGWNNPIIFVPGTGLRVRRLNGQKTLSPTDLSQTWIDISPEGKVKNLGSKTQLPVVTQPGRPFFASAGEDGDFSTGDDNIYSFEQ